MESPDIRTLLLGLAVSCLFVSGQTMATPFTFVRLTVNGNTSFKNDLTGAAISDSGTFAGELAEGTAAVGTLKALASATTAANGVTSLVQFSDSFTIVGNGKIGLSQNIHGTESVNGSGMAGVIGTLDLTAPQFAGLQTRYQKSTSTMGPNFENDQGPLTVSVLNGQVYTILATLTTVVANGAGSSTSSDYSSTNNIFITSLTPGVTIVAESGHDYAGPSAPVPLPNSWLLLATGVIGLITFSPRMTHPPTAAHHRRLCAAA